MSSGDHPEPSLPNGTDTQPPSSSPADAQNTAHPENSQDQGATVKSTEGETPTHPDGTDPSADESQIESGDQKDDAPAEKMSESSDVKEEGDSGPPLVITLLLITGARHPFKIDGKYLRKRSVNVDNYDPFAMSVYTLKELIWREWRSGKDPTVVW